MINLASLSALLRTLRQAGGPDGPAVPVARVPPVASLTPEDRPAGSGTAQVRAWSSSQARNAAHLDDELLAAPTQRREAALVRGQPALDSPGARAAASSTPMEGVDTDSAPLALTVGGRVLQNVLRASAGTVPIPPAIASPAPLVASPRASAVDVARGLAQAIAESGLFYESHLARWARREYPSSALAREPQASFATAVDGTATAGAGAPSEAATQMMMRQLDALDTRAIVWTGELWPGQRASVAFEEDETRTHEDLEAGGSEAASAWRTRVVLELPSLGRIEATLALCAERLDMLLEAQTPQARTRLAHAHPALASALAGARVELGQFAVSLAMEP